MLSQRVGSRLRLGLTDGLGDDGNGDGLGNGGTVGEEHTKKAGPHDAQFSGWLQNEPASTLASQAAHEAPKAQQKFPEVGANVADGALLGVRLGALETPLQKKDDGVQAAQFSSKEQKSPSSN